MMQIEPLYETYKDLTAMHLEITTRCNAACPMCPRHIGQGSDINPILPMTEITLEQFKSWFSPEYLKQMRRIYSCGNYGDPIAARDTLEIYKYIRECNDKVGLVIHTNGSARPAAWWEELATIMNGGPDGSRDDYVIFSVDGLWDTNHLYRRNTNFEKIYENMKAYTAAGGKARWDYIVFEHNEHQVEEAKKIADELGFHFFNVKKTTRWNSFDKDGRGQYDVYKDGVVTHTLRQPVNEEFQNENSIEFKRSFGLIPQFITDDEFNRLLPDPEAKQDMHVYDNQNKKWIVFKHNTLGIICRAKQSKYFHLNEIFVDGAGNVYPCCFLGGEQWRANTDFNKNDSSKKMIELNGGMKSISLRHNKLEDIIASPLYQKFLPLSFTKGHKLRSHQCSACCGEEYNNLDQGELGTTKRSQMRKEEREQNDV